MKTLVVEGWRTSCHSYALVNQQQLLHLSEDPRLRLFHRDMPFFQDFWANLDSGLMDAFKCRLAAIAPPPARVCADVTYRISYPFRIYPGAGRVFVFATNEFNRELAAASVGIDGRPQSAEPGAVDIVTPSSWSRRGFLQAGYAPERVHVIPHGIDPGLAAPLPTAERIAFRRSLRLADDEFAFLNVGAMTWNKGVGPLVAAFAIHRRSHPKSVLVLKGGDYLYGPVLHASLEEARRLSAEVQNPALGSAIRYVNNNLSWETISRLYRSADAYIAPYRAEGFNLPVLEAMAAGLPVLVSRGGASDDFCGAEHRLEIATDPMVCDAGDYLEPRIDSIVQQMNRIVEEPATRQRLARLAQAHAVRHFTWKRVTDRLTELLLAA
jgi:glycosyltransferase involved in cell wall biosynthesis